MSRRIFWAFLLACLLVLSASFSTARVSGWSNGGYSADPSSPDYGTHDWIAEHALAWLPSAEKQYLVDNLAAYLYGTELPDNNQAPDGIGDTTKHHVYFWSNGSLQDDAAATRASEEYSSALGFLRTRGFGEAAKEAGIMSHYIADMAVFGHVMGASTDWGVETHHSDYETYVNKQTSSFDSVFSSYLLFDGILAMTSAYDAAKSLAYDTTFDVDGDLNCTWMDQNYNWSNPAFRNRAGESLNLAVNFIADVLHTLYEEYPAEAYVSVPYHSQIKDYYCGPAALEMLFDFYGPDITQPEIADVARTAADGTYTSDMVRAAHFSDLSTSVGNEMPGSVTGYIARELGYAAFEYGGMTMEELKSLIFSGYPVIVLTTWHFRVAVGYNATHVTFQDSWYGQMYNMTYEAFDLDWDYYNHWALFVSPWRVEVSVPTSVTQESIFNITAHVVYPLVPPFSSDRYSASSSTTRLTLPVGVSLVAGETMEKTLGTGNLAAGASGNVTWTVKADGIGNYTIGVEAQGRVAGNVPALPSYPSGYSYEDRIGGFSQSSITVSPLVDKTPPTTVDDYDGFWHTTDFKITLQAVDDISGVAETYYRINEDAPHTLSADGRPWITTEGSNITLEYWSVDTADNPELPHNVLTGIKLDKTAPSGSVVINNDASCTASTSALLTLTATDAISGVVQMRFSDDDQTWTSWEPFETSKPWTITSANDGTKTKYAQFVDHAGLISRSYFDTIAFDQTPPTLTITAPDPGSELKSSKVAVAWTSSDETSGVSFYEIRVDGGSWLNAANNTTHSFVDLSGGNHIVDVKATDEAGNSQQGTVSFVVNTSPILGPGYGEELAIAGALIALALGVVVYFLRIRRR